MKQEIITELKKEHSRIRVIFATTEDDLLKNFSIYDELCASKLIALLDIYAPAI
jgi:hypothetical protein